jgi:hypothetical protein
LLDDPIWAENFFPVSILLLLIGYLLYFNTPTLIASIRRKKSSQTIWGVSDLGAQEIYEFLRPAKFVSDHIVYSILTPHYAIAFAILIGTYYLFYGLSIHPGTASEFLQNLLVSGMAVTFAIAYSSIPRFFATRWKDYPYFLAKSYLALSERNTNSITLLHGFIEGIEAYNTFLQRNFKIKIEGLQNFYSLLVGDEMKEQQEIVEKINRTFCLDR